MAASAPPTWDPRPPIHRRLDARPRVVIVGGGFGGMAAARALRKTDVDVVVIDRRNHHLFQPLLYQVATAVLSPAAISMPIRSMLTKQRNARVRLGEVVAIDPARRCLEVRGRFGQQTLDYDWLVLAAGATHSYFGNDQWEGDAPGLKTLDDALEIRRRVLMAYEAAEWTEDPDERRRKLTFVVVGGGATGVEIAGALSEIARRTSSRNFEHRSRGRPRPAGGGPAVRAYPDGPAPGRCNSSASAGGGPHRHPGHGCRRRRRHRRSKATRGQSGSKPPRWWTTSSSLGDLGPSGSGRPGPCRPRPLPRRPP